MTPETMTLYAILLVAEGARERRGSRFVNKVSVDLVFVFIIPKFSNSLGTQERTAPFPPSAACDFLVKNMFSDCLTLLKGNKVFTVTCNVKGSPRMEIRTCPLPKASALTMYPA